MHLRSILVTTVAALAASACAQLNVYRTYDDLVNKTPKQYPNAEFRKWSGQENTTLHFRNGKDDLTIECPEIWGFSYGEAFFRITTESPYFRKKGATQVGTPFVVTHLSDVVLYEYGLNLLDAMKKERDHAYVMGMCGALSRDLNSPMAPVPCNGMKWTDEEIFHLLDDNPDLSELRVWFDSRMREKPHYQPAAFELEWLRSMLRDRAELQKNRPKE